MKATLLQLAWYLERDGAKAKPDADGNLTITAPALGGTVSWYVPAGQVPELDRHRDEVYRKLADRRRKAAAR